MRVRRQRCKVRGACVPQACRARHAGPSQAFPWLHASWYARTFSFFTSSCLLLRAFCCSRVFGCDRFQPTPAPRLPGRIPERCLVTSLLIHSSAAPSCTSSRRRARPARHIFRRHWRAAHHSILSSAIDRQELHADWARYISRMSLYSPLLLASQPTSPVRKRVRISLAPPGTGATIRVHASRVHNRSHAAFNPSRRSHRARVTALRPPARRTVHITDTFCGRSTGARHRGTHITQSTAAEDPHPTPNAAAGVFGRRAANAFDISGGGSRKASATSKELAAINTRGTINRSEMRAARQDPDAAWRHRHHHRRQRFPALAAALLAAALLALLSHTFVQPAAAQTCLTPGWAICGGGALPSTWTCCAGGSSGCSPDAPTCCGGNTCCLGEFGSAIPCALAPGAG